MTEQEWRAFLDDLTTVTKTHSLVIGSYGQLATWSLHDGQPVGEFMWDDKEQRYTDVRHADEGTP